MAETTTSIWDIIRYYRLYWTTTLITIGFASLFEVMDLFVPYAVGQILDVLANEPLDGPLRALITTLGNWLGGSQTPTQEQSLAVLVLMGLVFLVTIVKAPIQPWLTHWRLWDTSFRAKRDHYGEAHAKLLTLPLDYFDDHNSGRIAALVARGISNHTWSYPQIVGQLFPKLVRVMAIAAILFLAEWRIGTMFTISFVILMTITLKRLGHLSLMEKRLERYIEDTQSRTSEIITNIKTVKAFAAESYELKRQNQRLGREFKVLDYRIHQGYVQLNALRTTLVQICIFVILSFALVAALQGYITLGYFVVVFSLSNMAYSEVAPIGNFAEFFARRFPTMANLDEFLKLPPGADAATLDPVAVSAPHAVPSTATQPSEPSPPTTFKGQLEFEQVTFGYDPDRPVLMDFDLHIAPRQTIALVGRSGSGKSTLVKLLFRYFKPDQGQICIDGQDIQQLDVTQYRQRLAIVHQEVDVFNGTLLENLTYGTPNASFEQVRTACQIARVEDFIHHFPKGYQTVVGERGIRLSGGQRQRLGIARALVRDPDILVFDEATSSLDYESERAIQLAMHQILGTRTTVIIAHRLSTVRDADQIVVLDQGRILEVGNHNQLLSQPGLYSRLHALQETGDLLD